MIQWQNAFLAGMILGVMVTLSAMTITLMTLFHSGG